MGQRMIASPARRSSGSRAAAHQVSNAALCIFSTELGWFGLVGEGETVSGLSIGHLSADEVRTAAADATAKWARGVEREGDWNPKLRRSLENYARGIQVNFDDVTIELQAGGPFIRRVLNVARRIRYGETVSYGELARRAGNPNAARAVGAAMASNTVPIIVPCHRVIASGGSLGGFSARQGINLKRRMLELESATALS